MRRTEDEVENPTFTITAWAKIQITMELPEDIDPLDLENEVKEAIEDKSVEIGDRRCERVVPVEFLEVTDIDIKGVE